MNIKKYILTVCVLISFIMAVPVSAAKEQTSLPISESAYYFKNGYTSKQIAYRKKVVKLAKNYLGIKEKSKQHKAIVTAYNMIKKNMYRNGRYQHFDVTTRMAWCDVFVSVMFQEAKLPKAIGVECGCEAHINLLKKMKCWVESDEYVPSTGDLIFFDWQDKGKGNNKGWADHVGIVVGVKNNIITTIEGNYDDTVKYRAIKVNGQYIRGFGVPKY